MHLNEKLCILNTVFKTKDLIFTFPCVLTVVVQRPIKTNKTNKKQKILVTDYKTCKFIVKTVKNTLETNFQKKLVPISKKNNERKIECAICLTEMI